ncbi:MAG: hypothetical protein ABI789_06680 [Usitatibacter sp.]
MELETSTAQTTCVAIRNAATVDHVIDALRSYLDSVEPVHQALLPAGLLTLGVKHAQEIAQAAVELAHREASVAAQAPEASFLKEAATVFSTAAMRLAVLTVS